eukprot:3099-Heterococcus_DN1.PRE.3
MQWYCWYVQYKHALSITQAAAAAAAAANTSAAATVLRCILCKCYNSCDAYYQQCNCNDHITAYTVSKAYQHCDNYNCCSSCCNQ